MLDVEKFLVALRSNKDVDGKLKPIHLADTVQEEIKIIQAAVENSRRTWRKIMDREDIIRMAREAGLAYGSDEKPLGSVTRFAALVAAHEREACAKVCDVLAVHPEYASDITKVAAQAIRARGQA